jgi:7,8-dihydropterin-6-yl-methyl-4-(beta-D-ribofuranosyl)aminobenzene 5'-phosphate synthase
VISSCGLVGIINTVRLSQQVTEVERVHAVVGGWHLADPIEDVIGRTACALI